MDSQTPHSSGTPLARAGKAFLNFSMVLAMIVLASLIGLGGAAFFIYKQLGNSVNVSKTTPPKSPLKDVDPEKASSDLTAPADDGRRAPRATVADASEWHFAEFSDKPRFIDVTYDGGRQHARLKVNTVLSSKPDVASSSVSDGEAEEDDKPLQIDPGSRYITDKRTGRVIGIDGSAGAAMEIRRAEVVDPLPATPVIRNPVPEVRVASPVLQYGRPVFDSDQPVQAAVSASTYLPIRKAQSVEANPEYPGSSFDVRGELSDEETHRVRRVAPNRQGANAAPNDQRFPKSDRTYIFGRN